jgi:hypothetical protein
VTPRRYRTDHVWLAYQFEHMRSVPGECADVALIRRLRAVFAMFEIEAHTDLPETAA